MRRPVATGSMLVALLAVGVVPAVAALRANQAVANDREFVLDHGHLDGFEVTYDDAASELVVSVKDDTRIHDPEIAFRNPEDVTIAYEDEQAILTLPPAEGPWAFYGEHGGTDAWVGTQSGGDQGYVPWVGWSTERLHVSLAGTGIEPAAGEPVSLAIEINGPGDVFTFMTDAFGAPTNRYIDTLADESNIIPVTANAHVHTNWVFTAEGDYYLTVTPSLATVGHGTIIGPSAEYHFRVGEVSAGPVETDLSIGGVEDLYRPDDTVTLTAIQDPDTGRDRYQWSIRSAGEDDWSMVPGETDATWSFPADLDLDGTQIMVQLLDLDDAPITKSNPVTLNIEAEGSGGEPDEASQRIVASLDPVDGALAISVDPDDGDVHLPGFALAADGGWWEAVGELRPVTVTDTRSDAPGWTISGQVDDFVGDAGSFSGAFLGWRPTVISQTDGQKVKPGKRVAPGFPAGEGLSIARDLASARQGNGTGTAELGAVLELRVPTDTDPGVYETTLTFTAM